MNVAYQLRESLQSLGSNPLRSALSIVGVVFGVASVVAMLSIGLGAEAEIEKLLDALGARNVHVTADTLDEAEWSRVLRSTTGLSARDVGAVRALLADMPGASYAVAAAWRAGDASPPLPGAKLDVFGLTPNYREVLGTKVAHGRSFTAREAALARPVALLGEGLAKSWYGEAEKAIGEAVRIDRTWVQVIGVIESSASMSMGMGMGDAGTGTGTGTGTGVGAGAGPGGNGAGLKVLALRDAVVMPLASAERRLGPQAALAPLERVIVKLPVGVDPVQTRLRLEKTLARLHRGAAVVTVTAAEEVIEQKRSTTRLFSYFLMTIALISLVVGGIGIANVMLASMVERIREVGLRRAIGAKRRHILAQFLTEALTICLLGGLVGGFVGMGVSLVIGEVTGWAVAFPWWGHAVAVAIATVVGIGAGLYPAILASRISPIEALQGRA